MSTRRPGLLLACLSLAPGLGAAPPVPSPSIARCTLWILPLLGVLSLVGLALTATFRRVARQRTRDLERELSARREAEEELRAYKDHLEEQVSRRTAELEESTLQFRLLVSQLPEMVIIHRDGVLVYANDTAITATGYDPEELLGKSILGHIHPEDRASVVERFEGYARGENGSYEVRMTTREGETRHVVVKPQPTTYQGRPAVISILEDITLHRKMERELRVAKEAAEAADRAKSEFLANMSHEIRTPLNAVIGFAELLHASVTDPSLLTCTRNIRAAGQNLLTLIGDILDLSKMDSGRLEIHPESVGMNAFLEELRQIYDHSAREKGLAFTLDLEASLPAFLELDSVRIRQILVNLLGNAIKFTASGGVVMGLRALPPGGEGDLDLVVEIRDTGIGIPREAHRSIFDPFRQQDGQSTRVYGGTGLGLAITLRLVTLMGGTLDVESEPGQGSTFRVTLPGVRVPAVAAPSERFERRTRARELPRFRPARVVVADDVASNRLLLAETLQKVCLETLEAADGQEALTLARQEAPDLVIMDLRMPRMDGFQALRALKADPATRNIPVLAYTASSLSPGLQAFLDEGFDGFLSKPVSMGLLLRELTRFLPLASGQAPAPLHPGAQDRAPAREAPPEVEAGPLSPLDPSDRAHLDREIGPLLASCEGAIRPGRIRELAQRLRALASNPGLASLAVQAAELEEAMGHFDLGALEAILARLREAAGGDPPRPSLLPE